MADSAKFLLILKDLLSGPAKKSTESLAKLEKQMGLTRDKMGRLRQSNGRFATDAQKAQLGISKTGEKAGGLIDLITKADVKMVALAGAALTLGGAYATMNRVIKTDSIRASLNVLTKGRGAAAFEQISDLAVKFGLDIDQTTATYASFLRLRFSDDQAREMIKLGADMQALGTNAEQVQSIYRAIGKIKAEGRVQGDELMMLSEAGMDVGLFKKNVAKALGIAESEVRRVQEAGGISSEIGMAAIRDTINESLHQTKAGESGQRFAENQLEGIRNVWTQKGFRLFSKLADKSSGGLSSGFKKAGQVLDDFSNSEHGAKTIKSLENAFRGFGEMLERVLPLIVEIGTEFASYFGQGYDWNQSLGFDGMGSWVDFIRKDVLPIIRLLGFVIGSTISSMQRTSEIVAGFFQAISSGFEFIEYLVGRAWEIGKNIGSALIDGLDSVLRFGSPSKEMIKLGGYTGRGFEKGLANTMPEDIGPHIGSSNQVASTAARIGGRSAKGGGPVSVSGITIQVSGAGNPEAVAAATLAAFEGNLGRVMSRMQLEAGA